MLFESWFHYVFLLVSPASQPHSIVFPLGLSSIGTVLNIYLFLPTQSCTPRSLLHIWWFLLNLWPGKSGFSMLLWEPSARPLCSIHYFLWIVYGKFGLLLLSNFFPFYVVPFDLKLWSSCLSLLSARIPRHAAPNLAVVGFLSGCGNKGESWNDWGLLEGYASLEWRGSWRL